jgi:sugar lactone lactonase YvrE
MNARYARLYSWMRGFVLFLCVASIVCQPGRSATPVIAKRVITTIAGTGEAGYSGDGGPGTEGEISNPYGVTLGPDGALYFCEVDNYCIRRLDLRTKRLSTVAGDRRPGYSGDRGPATDAALNQPYDVRFDHLGNLYLVELTNNVVRRVDHVTGLITTIAGNGTPGFSGDGGPAWKAQLRQPHSLVFDLHGGLLVADIGNSRVRRIDMKTGVIETFAGTGEHKWTPDGGLLPSVPLNGPRALDIDPDGNLFVVLRDANVIYRVDHKTNRIYRIAGTGERGYTGDGGAALQARLDGPKGLAYADDGSLYIADTENHAIRRVDLKTGVITTVAGTGERGDGPDGDPLHCKLARPHGIDVDRTGNVYIGDSENNRIRMIRDVLPPGSRPAQHPLPQVHRPAAPIVEDFSRRR